MSYLNHLLFHVLGGCLNLLPLYISEWVAQVCIGAQLHWHSIPHPAPHALGSLCPFSLSRKCASTFQKLSLRSNHTPTFRSSKLDTHVKISTNLGKKCGLRYNVSSTWRVRSWDPHRHPHLSLLYTSTNPTDFLSGSSCRKRLSRCPKAFRLCEYAQDVHSCPMALRLCCTPPPPTPPPAPSTPFNASWGNSTQAKSRDL